MPEDIVENEPADTPRMVSRGAWLLLAVFAASAAWSSLGEHLTDSEAYFLNRTIESGRDAGLLHRIQELWAEVCGFMERPSRLLGLLSTMGALLLVLYVRRPEGFSSLHATAGAMTVGAIGASATMIGTGAPFLLLLAGAMWMVSRILPLGPRALGFLSCAAIVAAALFLPVPDGTSAPAWTDSVVFGADLTALGIPAWSSAIAALVVLAAALTLAGEFAGFVLLVLAAGVTLAADVPGLTTAPFAWIAPSLAVPAALFAGAAPRSRAREPLPLLLLLFGTGLTLISMGFATTHQNPTTADRERLDWVAANLPGTAWIAVNGDRRQILRYYERCGHRTGHRSILIRHDEDLDRLMRVALAEKPPTICLIDCDSAKLGLLFQRYEVVPVESGPEGVLVVSFKRRG